MIDIARNYEKGPLKRKDIAKANGISAHYLENILITLKSRNLIRTTRGANGGFTLKTSPEKITMFDIISAFEGSLDQIHCNDSSKGCSQAGGHCSARKFWIDLHEIQMKSLKATSLQSLLDLENSGNGFDYSI